MTYPEAVAALAAAAVVGVVGWLFIRWFEATK